MMINDEKSFWTFRAVSMLTPWSGLICFQAFLRTENVIACTEKILKFYR